MTMLSVRWRSECWCRCRAGRDWLTSSPMASWFPVGLSAASLRAVYQALVRELVRQFGLGMDDTGEKEQPSRVFNKQLNSHRFAINVILAQWTQTPLPSPTWSTRTALIVRVCGWGERYPRDLRPGQVLFPSPRMIGLDREHFGDLLPSPIYSQIVHPCGFIHHALFTLSEARQLELDSVNSDTDWLAQLTRTGRFAAFDARRGVLRQSKFVAPASRLSPEDCAGHKVYLSSWAVRPKQPGVVFLPHNLKLFEVLSPEAICRRRAILRHVKKRW